MKRNGNDAPSPEFFCFDFLSANGFVGGDSPFLVTCGDYRKRHQITPHYAWLWTLAQAVNRTSSRSGSASEDDPAERGCSRSRTTLG